MVYGTAKPVPSNGGVEGATGRYGCRITEAILHTNAVPSDGEPQRIRELLAGPRTEAAELTAEIERIRNLLRKLTGKRDRLNDFIDTHLALISPARRLPDDVVAEIFAASLPSDRNAVMSGAESPLLLCHVCKAWRNLALLTPRLWKSLHIVAPGDASKLQQLNEAVDSWLSRSGVLPLSISLTLIHYASRWNKLRLKFDSHRAFKPLAILSFSDVPILETIVIEVFRPELGHLLKWDPISFLGTTSLRGVTLKGFYGFFSFPLPWNQLRHLFLGQKMSSWLTAAQGLDILQRSPNLEKYSLPVIADSDNGPRPLACRMEHLRQLSVVDMRSAATVFFQNLNTPNLQTLEYMSQDADMSSFTPVLASAHHLKHAIQMTADTMIRLLGLVPALRELIICYDSFSSPHSETSHANKLWTCLTPTAQNPDAVLCPDLQIVNFIRFQHTSDDVLLAFIQARTGSRFADIV
ncbi:hypothetical protein B0H13DRAFT_2348186 [Mycena leptocephala]|nr:hypothetical protein B0H13DRAFT_2348186 [Mycena leptocephala]